MNLIGLKCLGYKLAIRPKKFESVEPKSAERAETIASSMVVLNWPYCSFIARSGPESLLIIILNPGVCILMQG